MQGSSRGGSPSRPTGKAAPVTAPHPQPADYSEGALLEARRSLRPPAAVEDARVMWKLSVAPSRRTGYGKGGCPARAPEAELRGAGGERGPGGR